jgi:hypothetical protein
MPPTACRGIAIREVLRQEEDRTLKLIDLFCKRVPQDHDVKAHALVDRASDIEYFSSLGAGCARQGPTLPVRDEEDPVASSVRDHEVEREAHMWDRTGELEFADGLLNLIETARSDSVSRREDLALGSTAQVLPNPLPGRRSRKKSHLPHALERRMSSSRFAICGLAPRSSCLTSLAQPPDTLHSNAP